MSNAITIKKTVKMEIAGTAAAYQPTTSRPTRVRVFSNRSAHILPNHTGVEATTDNGMPISAGHPVIVEVASGDAISFIIADGEVSGQIWFTEV